MVHFATLFFLFLYPLCAFAAPPPQEFSLATVESGTWRSELSAQGRVRTWKEATLSAPFPAVVTSMSVEPGQLVIRGQKLAQLEIPDLQRLVSRIQAAQTRDELAEKRVDGAKRRVAEKLATLDEQLQLEESLSQAKSELDAAWQELENALLPLGQSGPRKVLRKELQQQSAVAVTQQLTQLRAPFSGSVARRLATEGSRMAGGAPKPVARAARIAGRLRRNGSRRCGLRVRQQTTYERPMGRSCYSNIRQCSGNQCSARVGSTITSWQLRDPVWWTFAPLTTIPSLV